MFGLSTASVARAVAQTNSYYGGQTPGATHVLFVNGERATRTCLLTSTNLGEAHHSSLSYQGTQTLGMC